jgi:hypothetical protein
MDGWLLATVRDHAPPRSDDIARAIAFELVRKMKRYELLVWLLPTLALCFVGPAVADAFGVVTNNDEAAAIAGLLMLTPIVLAVRWSRRRYAAALELGRHGTFRDGVLCSVGLPWAICFDARGRARVRRWRGELPAARVVARDHGAPSSHADS